MKALLNYLYNVFTGGRAWRDIEKRAELKIRQVEELRDKWLKAGPQYITLRAYNTSDPEFIKAMVGIAESLELRWVLEQIKQRAVTNMVDSELDRLAEGAAINIGVILAVAQIEKLLAGAINDMKALEETGAQ